MGEIRTARTYDFGSVGENLTQFRQTNRIDDVERVPIGIKTPMELAPIEGGLFKMHFDLVQQIKDNFRNLLLTNHGERVGMYDFGANLRALALELGNEDFDSEAIVRITNAVDKYMPYINLNTFEPSTSVDENAGGISVVTVRIIYDLPLIGTTGESIEVVIYAAG